MLTLCVPEGRTFDKILAEVQENPVMLDGITYYDDGLGGLHADAHDAAVIAYNWTH